MALLFLLQEEMSNIGKDLREVGFEAPPLKYKTQSMPL
jgi:hypothetical protein